MEERLETATAAVPLRVLFQDAPTDAILQIMKGVVYELECAYYNYNITLLLWM